MNLVPRLFDATGGQVLVDGVDVRELAPEQLWTRIGLVPQRAYLFTGTVASNLRYGDPDATDEQLWDALATAQAREFVEAMPGGLDAPIAQGGTNVSGGQRQRLAIARALVRRPEIYLFDDAFSALDLATDRRLRAALRPRTRDACVLIVAQRVSTIVDADQIVVLDDGVVVGRGRHDELLRGLPDLCRDRRVPAGGGGRGMSERTRTRPAVPARLPPAGTPGRGPGGGRGGPWGNAGVPVEKSLDFWPSALRLIGLLRRQRWAVLAALLLTVTAVSMQVIAPKVLARATDLIFDGVIGQQLPAGISKDEALARLRESGQGQIADLVSGTGVVPGQGIDFAAVGTVLMSVLALYVASSMLWWLQGYLLAGAVQRTILRLRADVEDKLNRLPLIYFDGQPRGEVLSRVTNDIDNVAPEPAADAAASCSARC